MFVMTDIQLIINIKTRALNCKIQLYPFTSDKPYEFEYQVLQSHVDVDGILLTVQKLADLYADYINKVQLSDQFRSYGSLTYLDKVGAFH